MRDGISLPIDYPHPKRSRLLGIPFDDDPVILPAMTLRVVPPAIRVAKMPFVPVPRRNPETSLCEVRKQCAIHPVSPPGRLKS
jgi:hypothetical protein